MARAKGGLARRSGAFGKTTTQRLTGASRYDKCRMGTVIRADSATWKSITDQVLRRDGYRCKCGSTDRLTVDHIIPHAQGGPTTLNNLITLCFTCHCNKMGKANRRGAVLLKRNAGNTR